MLTKSKIALSVALVLATASAAFAAPKHAVRPHAAIPANAYLSFGSVRPTNSVNQPSNMKIQDIGFKENLGG